MEFIPSESTIEAFAKYHDIQLEKFTRSDLQKDILSNHITKQDLTNAKSITNFTTINGNEFTYDPDFMVIIDQEGGEVPLVKHLNGQYELKGILLTQDQLQKLEQYKIDNSDYDPVKNGFYISVISFNLGINIMINKIAGSESQRVKQCQVKYNGGWSDKWDLSQCSKNAADLLRQYDILSLQEVPTENTHALFKEINMNGDYEFFASGGTINNVIVYKKAFYHKQKPKTLVLPFPTHYKNDDTRSIQTIWFGEIGLIVINVHAPHFIPLKQDLIQSLTVIQKKLNVKPKRVIMLGDFNDNEGTLLNQSFKIFGLSVSIPNQKKVISCCTDVGYTDPGDYIFVSDPQNVTYYDLPPKYNRDIDLMSDHDPVSLKYGYSVPESLVGTIEIVGTFVGIQFDNLDPDGLFSIAQDYVQTEQLGWKISKPRSWFTLGLKPHVTLGKQFMKNVGEKVQVKFGKIIRSIDEKSYWVMISVTLPTPYSCGSYTCHLTIGQERY